VITIADVASMALKLPEATEGVRWQRRTWLVGGKAFAWERPLGKADIKRLGSKPPPAGPLVAVLVANLEEKELLMMDPPDGFFDIAHFAGYPAVLIRLDAVDARILEAALVEAWYACAPPKLAAAGPARPRR
jgi:hypothetical protein